MPIPGRIRFVEPDLTIADGRLKMGYVYKWIVPLFVKKCGRMMRWGYVL